MEICSCRRSSRLCARTAFFLVYINDLAEDLVSNVSCLQTILLYSLLCMMNKSQTIS